MSTGNGNVSAIQPMGTELTATIARSMASSLRGSSIPQPEIAQPSSDQQSIGAFATRLDELISASPELRRAVEERMARNVRQALSFGDSPLPSTAEFIESLHAPPIAVRGGTFVRGDWWGFQVYVSHADLDVFLATAAPLTVITATLVAGLWPPAAPFVTAIAAFIAGALALLRTLDKGRGVWISMSWFAAGVFVPTTA